MPENSLITKLKVVMVIGIIFIVIGHYILSYSNLPETMGIYGLILGAGFVAVGLIMSLPTKMYLTFVFVTREQEKNKHHNK